MSDEAKPWFGGTKYEAANSRWRDQAVRQVGDRRRRRREQARQELFAKMVQQATAAWPGIERGVKADEGFNPAEGEKWKGRTVKLKGVYNRAAGIGPATRSRSRSTACPSAAATRRT